MRILIVGAGGAATALATALTAGPQTHVTVWGRRSVTARRAARLSRSVAEPSLARALADANLVLLAVSDAAVATVARRIARAWPRSGGPRVVLHLAGALPAERIAPLRACGAAVGVFHPVVALTGAESAAALPSATVTLSGDDAAVRAGRALARRLGLVPLRIDDRARPLVHLAAVLAAGDLVALLGVAEELASAAGIHARAARRMLAQLAAGAVGGYAARGAGNALTGPAARGDAATVALHVAALRRGGARQAALLGLHLTLVGEGARLAGRSGRLSAADLRRLRTLLRSLPG